jgi:hypothetical protein
MKRAFLWKLSLLCAGGVLIGLSGCAYSLAGRGSFLPEHIQTIGIPTFANTSTQSGVAEIFTEKVIEEFASRGKYVITPDAVGVDAVLAGAVTTFTVAPETLQGGVDNPTANQASRYSMVVRAQIQFRDLVADTVIWEDGNFAFRESWDVGEESDQFFDQQGLAIERAAEEFAKTLVSRILEAF